MEFAGRMGKAMSENWSGGEGERPVRVLWIAQSCSLQDEKENPGLTGRMESMLTRYCADRVRLAVAYMADGAHESRFTRDGIVYYAVNGDMRVGITERDWERTKAELLRIAEDFHPDVIQCFGAEWPYGAIAGFVDIPVVIHMMGFLNVYFLSLHMARGDTAQSGGVLGRAKAAVRRLIPRDPREESAEERRTEAERNVMRANRFFFGRTRWDRNIVKYYAEPGARYFHMPEMIKPRIYDAAGQWRYHAGDKIRLFSLSSGDDRKGNGIILQTAQVLKNLLHLDFEWRVAGDKESFRGFEQRTGIHHEEVNTVLLGLIGSGEIVDELKAADFFIHPSIMDNSPHAVCEAQLIGCPVIASNVGGVADLVEDGETGFLYPYNEPHTLAFTVANLLGEEKLLGEISEKEVRTARERHDPEKIAHLLVQAYQTITEAYKNGR